MAQQEAVKNGESKPSSSKKPKKSKKKDNDSSINDDSRSSSSSVDIPIFRDEFLELNKAREAELRSLRKTVTEFEEQNAVLQKHVDNMKTAVTKLECDVTATKENTEALEKQYQGLQKLVLTHLSHIQVPNFGSVNEDNIEEFVSKLLEVIKTNSNLKETVRKSTANMDLNPALPNV